MDPVEAGHPWYYRGEGNSSLVLYSPSTRGTLRLRKLFPRVKASESANFSPTAIVDYVQSVVRKMFVHTGWIPSMTVVKVEHQLESLLKDLDVERDPHRRPGKHTFHPYGILMPDLCFLTYIPDDHPSNNTESCHSFSVELKPKEGTMPTDNAAHEIRRRFSKYTLKQRMKLDEGIISSANDYDPLDLFSGDRLRTEKCLRSLIKNPQNNFRFFVNGKLVYGARDPQSVLMNQLRWIFSSSEDENASSCLRVFFDLVITALLKPRPIADGNFVEKTNGLHPSCILGALLQAQKTGNVDIEPLYPQYLQILNLFSAHPGLRERLGIDGPSYNNAPFWTERGLDSFSELTLADLEALKNLRNYLASATVKDCSLFLTFSFHSTIADSDCTMISNGSLPEVFYKAHLIDLDPKPFERVEKHFLEAKKLIRLAEQVETNEK